MKGVFRLCITMLFLCSFSNAQAGAPQAASKPADPAAVQPPAETSNFTSAKGFVLEDATPVKLRFNRTVSSADAHVGDTVDFEVMQDISVNGTLVIAKGALPSAQLRKRNRSDEWRGEENSRSISTM